MFAFAIWNRQKRELFLARDRFGIKPLCLHRSDDGIAFASEIQAFAGLGTGFKKELRPESLDLYLYYGYIPAPASVFRSVYKLPPGHYCFLRAPDAPLEFIRYWQFQFRPDKSVDHNGWKEGLSAKVADAVRSHLIADVPVGAFLSGGIDSSVVVAAMTQTCDSPIGAYTIGFAQAEFDERSVTRTSARMLPIEYHEEQLELDVLGTLDRLVERYGEPFADSSAICTYRVTETAARDVKVMLSGDGGDEIFGGYSHYGWMLEQFLPTFAPAMRLRLKATDLLRRRGLLGARTTPLQAWTDRNACFPRTLRDKLWQRQFQTLPAATDDFLHRRFHALNSTAEHSMLDTIQTLDIEDYLVYNNLNKVDIASMCHGLEVRVPLLDHELVEFAATIPWNRRIQPLQADRTPDAAMFGRVHKYPLRELAEGTFGHGFFDRRKMGFTMPIGSWLAQDDFFPVLRDHLTSPDSPLLNYFCRESLDALLAEHRVHQNRGHQLWSLLFLSKWMQQLSR